MNKEKKQIALIVLDGWGMREEKEYNAIVEAQTPFFDLLWSTKPHTLLDAAGLAVGLPEGVIGNSEIGHGTIGIGRTIDTDVVKINKAIENNELGRIEEIKNLFDHVKKYDSVCHVFGMVSPASVHSHSDHLYGFLRAAKEAGIEKVAIHAFTDGRDTPPQSAAGYLEELEEVMDDLQIGFIATAAGRFYGMDRDNNWDRIEKAEEAIFGGKAGNVIQGKKPSEVLKELYINGVIDEHLEPVVFLDENGKSIKVEKNDGAFFFNYRYDRARQMAQKFISKQEELNLYFVAMTDYDSKMNLKAAFKPDTIETTLSEQIFLAGLRQAHIAETEKFAHVTFYFNSGREKPYENEEDIIIPSRRDVKTHDEAPRMMAKEIADKAIEQIQKGTDFILVNLANADMIGHTANREALIEAVEAVDFECDRIVDAIAKAGGVALVTADHGNAEIYYDPVNDSKHTAHTINQVPFIIAGLECSLKDKGTLADIAPTVLEIFGLEKPQFMTGHSLIIK
ncbi:MAG: 2,3-bisphosphoglycerate-independent phosphoglycerate mutase [Candidatus Buchananbacteria bacterium]|jgi:2,3-bisphosphoglycerate-independent phosphoglycerate mutase